jgi:hypothetical protein
MEYLIIQNGKIEQYCCGAEMPENAVQVSDWSGSVGEPVSWYDPSTWKRYDDSFLYGNGIKAIPEGYKLNEDKTAVVEMTLEEKIKSGMEKVPAGFKLEDGNLVSKTLREKFEDNEITLQAYIAESQKQVRTKRTSCIEAVQWRIDRYRDQRDAGAPTTETAEAFSGLLSYCQALRDIPQQRVFATDPGSVEWPELSISK